LSRSLTDEGLFQFSSALQTLTSLESLSLIRLGHSKFSQAIELTSQGITPLTQLKDLSLDFTCCSGEKCTTIYSLAGSFLRLRSLNKLNLNLPGCRFIGDEDLALLTQGLETLRNLTHLAIDLTNIGDITNQGLKSLTSSFSNFGKVRQLTLKLISNKIDGDGLRIIAQDLQSLPALYSFDLVFCNRYHTNYNGGFGALCDILLDLTSLREIRLAVKNTEITAEKNPEISKSKVCHSCMVLFLINFCSILLNQNLKFS